MRLDKIVVHVAANILAEVCSVYVLRADQRLELYATEGLNRKAVHRTTVKLGEGLIGLVAASAEPLSLPEAQEHPAFSSQTGAEIYRSFLGVPILRGGNTLGVLVVQNKSHRVYSDEDVEALETTAMALAELIASGELHKTVSKPISAVHLKRIPEFQVSRGALINARETLDGFAGKDVAEKDLGNLNRAPISSDDLEMLKRTVNAALQIHESPKVTKHHANMLSQILDFLKVFNTTLDALTETTDKTTKLTKSVSKLGATIMASGTGVVVFVQHISPILVRVTDTLKDTVAAIQRALGL